MNYSHWRNKKLWENYVNLPKTEFSSGAKPYENFSWQIQKKQCNLWGKYLWKKRLERYRNSRNGASAHIFHHSYVKLKMEMKENKKLTYIMTNNIMLCGWHKDEENILILNIHLQILLSLFNEQFDKKLSRLLDFLWLYKQDICLSLHNACRSIVIYGEFLILKFTGLVPKILKHDKHEANFSDISTNP